MLNDMPTLLSLVILSCVVQSISTGFFPIAGVSSLAFKSFQTLGHVCLTQLPAAADGIIAQCCVTLRVLFTKKLNLLAV